MLKIMKKSMLLVIFSFVLTVFWSTLAFATVDEPGAAGLPDFEGGQVIIDTNGGDCDGNEGDPDGYKEGWDTDSQENIFGPDEWDMPWDENFIIWLILSNYSFF